MIHIPYGEAFLFRTPLINAGGQDFADDQAGGIDAIAAGDAQVQIRGVDWANVGCESIAFTSGSEEPLKGHVLTGATSGNTVVVVDTIVTSGTWAGTNAAGILVVELAGGALQSENLNNTTTGNNNTLTIGADVSASTLEYDSNYGWGVGITSAQALTDFGVVRIKDQTGTELWEDQDVHFMTVGRSPRAGDPRGVLYAGTATSVAAGTLVGENLDDGFVRPVAGDEDIGASLMIYIQNATVGAGQAVAVSSYDHASRTFTNLYNWPLTPTGTIEYEIYSIARAPAHVIAAFAGSMTTEIVTGMQSVTKSETDTVNDAAATTTAFTTTTDQGTNTLYGVCRFTDGAQDVESRLCKWTSTTMTILSDSSMDAAQKQWSAAPGNGDGFKFTPVG